ncbi:hypothetical protein NFJ02_07g133270 [Pycnococcus provasolii]
MARTTTSSTTTTKATTAPQPQKKSRPTDCRMCEEWRIGKKFWLRNKSWQIDQWRLPRFADMSPAVDVRKGGGGGGGARKEAAEERRRSLSPSERSSQRGEEQDDEYGGSDLSPITRRSRTLLHNMKGERRCITDLANHGLLTLL